MARIITLSELKRELHRSLDTVELNSFRFTAEVLEECKAYRGSLEQKNVTLHLCTFDVDPTPLIQLFKPHGKDLTIVRITYATVPDDDWTSVVHAISELGWSNLELNRFVGYALYSALRGLMNHPMKKLTLDGCAYYGLSKEVPVIPVLCEALEIMRCGFQGVYLPCTFPSTTMFEIARTWKVIGLMNAIESMTQLVNIGFDQIHPNQISRILSRFRGSTEDKQLYFFFIFIENVTQNMLDSLVTLIKQAHASRITLEFYVCEGSGEDMLRFLKQVQFEPVQLGSRTSFNDHEASKGWPAKIEWYNTRVKANREFMAMLYTRRRQASDQPMLADLPAAMRYQMYLDHVGGPFIMEI
jgi:hypothetical protein